jgi:hypothetical protein
MEKFSIDTAMSNYNALMSGEKVVLCYPDFGEVPPSEVNHIFLSNRCI